MIRAAAAAVVFALVLGASSAVAEPPAADSILIVESGVGAPASHPEVLDRFTRAVGELRPLAPAAPLRTLWSSRGRLSESELSALETTLNHGLASWQDADFKSAVERLSRAIGAARRRPQSIATSIDLRKQLLVASTALVLAYRRLGDEAAARRAMIELAVSFPGEEIPFTRFGPEPIAMRRKVEAELDDRRAAALAVEVSGDPGAAIYINERPVGTGVLRLRRPLAGEYRIFAVGRGGAASRAHTLTIGPGETSKLVIDLGFEGVVVTTPRLRLQFPDEKSRAAREVEIAALLGRLAGAGSVVVLRVLDSSMAAALITSAGKTVRNMEVPTAARARAIDDRARWLVGAPIRGLSRSGAGSGGEIDGGWLADRRTVWALAGAGALSLGLGVTYFAIDRPAVEGGVRRQRSRDTFTHGILATSVGAVLLSTAGLLWWRGRGETDSTAVGVGPREGGAMVSLSGRF